MVTLLVLVTAFVTVATLLPLWRNPHWLIRGWDFPRLQLAVLALLLIFLQLIWLDLMSAYNWILVGLAAAALAFQLWWIIPYTRFWPTEVKGATRVSLDNRLRILTANVLTPNRNTDGLLKLVSEYQPDVVLTLETDQWWQERLDSLQANMPHSVKCPLDNLYGMHLYSSMPLKNVKLSYLVESDVPSIHANLQLRSGVWVRVHFLHPAPPSPSENTESTERDAELVVVAREVADLAQPVVVAGDLNDVAWSETTRLFRKISGLLDPRVGRGMFNTFHAKYPLMRWPLDHLFHSHHFTVSTIKRLPGFGSDHFPLLTELSYEPSRGQEQNGLNADADDEAMADDIAEAKP